MKQINLVWDREELINSKAFQVDEITKGVNALNDEIKVLGLKCKGIVIKPMPEDQRLSDYFATVIDVDGFLLKSKTVIQLIQEGIIKLEE
jgi:hypothetical protein